MRLLRNRSIKSKIIIMNMTITVMITSIAFIIFSLSEINRQKTILLNNVKLDVKLINEAIYASVDFNYKKEAELILSRLSVKPYLYDCILFDRKNNFFVSYTTKNYQITDFEFDDRNRNNYFSDDFFYYRSDTLNKQKKKIGSIYTLISTKIYKDRINKFMITLFLLFLLVFVLSFILSLIMQKFISKPILDLANTTKNIKNIDDLNIEVSYQSSDAIGTLYNNFNDMIRTLREKEVERKEAEKVHKDLQMQLQQSQKMEAIGQLAGGIAHDFNNILTAINGYADLAMIRAKEDESLSKMIKIISESGKRATDLTKQLLAFSRKQIIEINTITLSETIKEMQSMLLRLIEEDTELRVNCEKECFIDADKSQIEQIIMNLVLNARDAIRMNTNTDRKKTIKLETKIVEIDNSMRKELNELNSGKYVLFSVSDSGIGMDTKTKEKIFEPFFTTKSREKGTGLGLSTVYGIVKQNRGTIYVYSEVNEGTTFKIYWPLSAIKSDISKTYETNETVDLIRGSERILLVEDDKEVLNFTSSTLSLMGYRIFTANSGKEALQVAQSHNYKFDLIISDVVMPEMSGPDFIKIYRKYDNKTKVLFTSGYTFDLIVQNGIVMKNINFISKPYSTAGLSKKIRELID